MSVNQLTGMMAFGLCAVIAGLCAWRLRSHRGLWSGVAVLNLLICLELLTGNRHSTSGWLQEMFLPDKDRQSLRQLQIDLLLWSSIVFSIALAVLYRRLPTQSLKICGIAVFFGYALIAVEMISFHTIDAILYHRAPGLSVIAWIWVLIGGIGIAGSLKALRESAREDRPIP